MREAENLVSVVMPAFNAAETLAAAVDSVLNQTHRQLELIMVDDGSRDRTGEIARTYAARDRRFRYVRQENAGCAAARNRGIEVARGRLIAFLDADDLYDRSKLERQLAVLRGTRGDAVALTQIVRFIEKGGNKTLLAATAVPQWPPNETLPKILQMGGSQMALFTTALVPRRSLLRAGKFDPRLPTAQDWDLGLRLGAICSFRAVQEPLYLYRKHAGSITATENLEQTLRIQLDVLRRAADRAKIPASLRRKAERGRYLELIRGLIYHRRFGPAWRMLLTGCLDTGLYLERQFPELCVEIAAGRLGFGDRERRTERPAPAPCSF